MIEIVPSPTVTTQGGIWSRITPGPMCAYALVATSVNGQSTRVGVRLVRASGEFDIVPDNLLGQDEPSTRVRLVPTPLGEDDSIWVMSDLPVHWVLNAKEEIPGHQLWTLGSSGGVWQTVMEGAANGTMLGGLMCANLGMGPAKVSVRRQTPESLLVLGETLDEAGTGRMAPVITLAQGEVLQVMSTGRVDWVISGANLT